MASKENKEQIREQQLAMITSWKQSGQNQRQFCLQNNIAYHVFHYWYKVYRDEHSTQDGSFVALNIAAPQQADVEVHFADGKRILFHQPVSVTFLKALIA